MLIMVYMFISPLEWAFNLKIADPNSVVYAKPIYLVVLEVVLEVFFVLDVYIHFRTGYTNKNDETVCFSILFFIPQQWTNHF